MKGLKKLIVLFVYIGMMTSSSAADFLDRFYTKKDDFTFFVAMGNVIGVETSVGAAIISNEIGKMAMKNVLPVEYALRQKFVNDMRQHKKNVLFLEKKLTNLMVNPESYKPVTKFYFIDGVRYQTTPDIKAVKYSLRADMGVERQYHAMKARKLREVNKTLKAAHRSMMTKSKLYGYGFKVPTAKVKHYQKVFRASKLITFLSAGVSVYFLSRILVDCGIIVFTDENLEESLSTIESGDYAVEKLRSGMYKLGDKMDVERFEAELLLEVEGKGA